MRIAHVRSTRLRDDKNTFVLMHYAFGVRRKTILINLRDYYIDDFVFISFLLGANRAHLVIFE